MSGGSNSTNTNFRPPDYAKQYDKDLLAKAGELSNTPFQGYTGQRIAPFNNQQQLGFNMASQYAGQGNALANAGGQQMFSTLNGNYLNSNPYIDSVVGRATGDIADQYKYMTEPGNMAMASHSGSLDNSGVAGKDMMDRFGAARAMGDAENQIRYNNYAGERANQVNAVSPALGYGQTTQQGLMGAGNQQQQMGQNQQDFNYSEFLRQLQQPTENLNTLQQALATAQGGFGNQHTGGVQPGPVQIGSTLAGSYLQGMGSGGKG